MNGGDWRREREEGDMQLYSDSEMGLMEILRYKIEGF